jgi:hypothetical protein
MLDLGELSCCNLFMLLLPQELVAAVSVPAAANFVKTHDDRAVLRGTSSSVRVVPLLTVTSVGFQESELGQSFQVMIDPIRSALRHVDLICLLVRHVAGNNRSMQMI